MQNKSEKQLIKELKKLVKKDSEIIVIIHRVNKSGTQRKMSVFIIYKKQLVNINWHIDKLEIAKRDQSDKLIVKGCGYDMDIAFDLSYQIKCKLYGYETGINNQQYKAIY